MSDPLAEKRVAVPEGMLDAAVGAICEPGRIALSSDTRWPGMNACLKAALRWQDGELEKLIMQGRDGDYDKVVDGYNQAITAVRRMFLASEPEVPEEIKDLVVDESSGRLGEWMVTRNDKVNAKLLEAFRRGQQEKKL